MATKMPGEKQDSSWFPYAMRFSDGRTVAVEIPGRMVVRDRDGEVAFTPQGVRFLDHLRALFMPLDRAPSPAYVRRLREALGMSQRAFGEEIGVGKLTVARWEWGKLKPGGESIRAIKKSAPKRCEEAFPSPAKNPNGAAFRPYIGINGIPASALAFGHATIASRT